MIISEERLKRSFIMNLIEYLNRKGLVARRKNAGEFCSPCPVCGGKDRFTFWPDRGRYYCRGCNKSGDIIDLLRSVDGLNYAEACRIAGKDIRKHESTLNQNSCRPVTSSVVCRLKASVCPDRIWQAQAAAFSEWAHGRLLRKPEQLAWLKEYRGINLDTVKRFKLGWNDKDRYHARANWNLPEVRKANGRLKALWLPCGLVIPCYSLDGEFLRLKIRRPDSEIKDSSDVRYVFIPGGSVALAFFGTVRPALIVVESELDAILLHQECGNVVTPVATGGARNRPDQSAHRVLSQADRLLISLDNDRPGEQAALNCWRGVYENSRFWLIPRKYGKDHTEALKNGLDLRGWLSDGMQAALSHDRKNDAVLCDGASTCAC